MKANKHLLVFIVLCLALFAQQMAAQVTIGSSEAPVSGAALQIKTISNAGDSVNSTLGFALPRVNLTKKDQLFPMLTASYNKEVEDGLHTGLIVYNIGENDGMKPGLYVWDGALWMAVGAGGNNGTGCIINKDLPEECIDTDCDGICDKDDSSPNDPCNAVPDIQINYTLNGTTSVLSASSPTITVKQNDDLTLEVTEKAGEFNKITKVMWNTGATSKSINVNTSTLDSVGKEFTVRVNNCSTENALRKVTVITDVNECNIIHSGGLLHQSFTVNQSNYNPVKLKLPGGGSFNTSVISNTTGIQDLFIINLSDGELTISLNPSKIKSTMPTGGITLRVTPTNSGCNTFVDVIASWGSLPPFPQVTLLDYAHKQTYSTANPYNVGDIRVKFSYTKNREFGTEGGLLVQEWNSATAPAKPTPTPGGSNTLIDGNLAGFNQVPMTDNKYTLTDVVSSLGKGKMYTVIAWAKGVDGKYYYGNSLYVTGVSYNRPDLLSVKYIQTITSAWGSSTVGSERTWLQYEITINPNRKNDGYKRDAQGYGTYTARNVMPNRLTADSVNNSGIWIMTEDAAYEHPDLVYGVNYAAPSLSNPTGYVKWSKTRDQAALDNMELLGLSYYVSGIYDDICPLLMEVGNDGICPNGWRHMRNRELQQILNTVANEDVNVDTYQLHFRGYAFNKVFAHKSWYAQTDYEHEHSYSDTLGMNFFFNGNTTLSAMEAGTRSIATQGSTWLPKNENTSWDLSGNLHYEYVLDVLNEDSHPIIFNGTTGSPNQTNVRCVLAPKSRKF